VVKCNLTKLQQRDAGFPVHLGPWWSGLRSGHHLMHTCTGSHRSCGLSVAAHWLECCAAFVFSLVSFVFSSSTFLIFLLHSHYPSFFRTVITVWQVPGCPFVGAHGWVAEIASHGSILLSRGLLITVEAPGHPRHIPLSLMQLLLSTSLYLFFILLALMLPVLYIRHLTTKKHSQFKVAT